jgi:hypothetical protein
MFDFQILYCVTAIVWYYYASLEGIIESHYFHKNKLANDFNNKLWLWDIHVWFSFRRGLVAFLLLVIDYLILKYFGFTPLQILFSMVMKSLSFILSFPMFHNGFYYIARKKMDPAQQFTGFRTDDFTND